MSLHNAIAEKKNLYQMFHDAVTSHLDYVALVLQTRRMTCRELFGAVTAAARGFAAAGIGKGDRVALLLPNTPTYVIAFYALQARGAVAVNLSPSSQGAELAKILADSGAVAVVTLDLFLPGLYKVLAASPGAVKQLFFTSVQGLEQKIPVPPGVPPLQRFEQLMAPSSPPASNVEVAPDDLALLQYTSGSTGAPKGVMLSHRNILASVAQTASWMHHQEVENGAVVCILPFFHVFGMIVGLHLSVALGYRMILVPRFDALDLMPIVEILEKERPISFPAVPTLWAALVENPRVTAQTLSSILVASSGGAPLASWVQDKYRALTGRQIYEAYGLSEAAGATHCVPFPGGGPEGSIGLPLGGLEARLADPQNGADDVATGEVGEILLRGASITSGYFRNEALSNQMLKDGWLHTGDLARRDDNGFYYIVDRKDDLILTSGHNVYPSEVEPVLAAHPAVKEVAVVGKPDRMRGAIVIAYVVPRPDMQASLDELLSRCRDNLPDWKVPRRIVFVESLPKNPAGKTLRKTLRDAPEPA